MTQGFKGTFLLNLLRAGLGYLALKRNSAALRSVGSGICIIGHRGLGDQITLARLYEHLCDTRSQVHTFVDTKSFEQIQPMFRYLENLYFHKLPPGQPDVKYARDFSAKVKLPLIVVGRRSLDYLNFFEQEDGMQTRIIRTAGLEVGSLHSSRFRDYVRTLPQLPVSAKPYAFLNLKSSVMTFDFPPELDRQALPNRIFEAPDEPIYSHVDLLLNADEHWSIGSAFMCLSLVLGPTPSKKYYIYGRYPLGKDDPLGEWSQLFLEKEALPSGDMR